MNTLEMIKEEAAKAYPDPAQLDAFMEGFEKQAGFGIFGNPTITEAALKTLGSAGVGLAAGLAGALLVKGLNSGGSAITNGMLRSKFESALQQVMNTNKIVKGANPTKVHSYAQTLFSFAPHVCSDANILSTILANVIQGEGVDPITIKSITDLEGRYKENNSSGPLPGIRM